MNEATTTQVNKCPNCGANLKVEIYGSGTCSYCGGTYNINQRVYIDDHVDSDDNSQKAVRHTAADKEYIEKNYISIQYPDLPQKKKPNAVRLTFIAFFSIWVALYFCRMFMPDGKTNLSQHNNLLFSPIGGTYWVVRGIILLIILPIITIYLYKNSKKQK